MGFEALMGMYLGAGGKDDESLEARACRWEDLGWNI